MPVTGGDASDDGAGHHGASTISGWMIPSLPRPIHSGDRRLAAITVPLDPMHPAGTGSGRMIGS